MPVVLSYWASTGLSAAAEPAFSAQGNWRLNKWLNSRLRLPSLAATTLPPAWHCAVLWACRACHAVFQNAWGSQKKEKCLLQTIPGYVGRGQQGWGNDNSRGCYPAKSAAWGHCLTWCHWTAGCGSRLQLDSSAGGHPFLDALNGDNYKKRSQKEEWFEEILVCPKIHCSLFLAMTTRKVNTNFWISYCPGTRSSAYCPSTRSSPDLYCEIFHAGNQAAPQ